MKFSQLIEYNMKIISLTKLCKKYGDETNLNTDGLFLKKANLSISLDQQTVWDFIQSFYCMSKSRTTETY